MKPFGQCGVIGMVCVVLLSMSQPACTKVVYVSPTGSDGNDGLSWAKAKRTVKAALLAALPGDQVWVRYGVYVECITLKNGVSLYGGFRGDETSLSQRPAFPRPSPDRYETVLDGNLGGVWLPHRTPLLVPTGWMDLRFVTAKQKMAGGCT